MGGYSEVYRCDSSKILESAEIWSVENETKVASGVGCSERAESIATTDMQEAAVAGLTTSLHQKSTEA